MNSNGNAERGKAVVMADRLRQRGKLSHQDMASVIAAIYDVQGNVIPASVLEQMEIDIGAYEETL